MDDLQQKSVGALLKHRRIELGLSLADIAARTHIRSAYLEALEDGRYSDLPGLAYQVGFLRNYAEMVGLEPGRVVQQWRNETVSIEADRRSEPAGEPRLTTRTTSSRRLPGRAIFFLLLLLLLAAAVYYVWPGSQPAAVAPMAAMPVQESQQFNGTGTEPATGDKSLPQAETLPTTELTGAQMPAAGPDSLTVLPEIPATGGVVRLEALRPLALEVTVDSRPSQRYALNTASALQWNVERSVRLTVDDPGAARVWFGSEPLDLAGRSEIVLQAATAE